MSVSKKCCGSISLGSLLRTIATGTNIKSTYFRLSMVPYGTNIQLGTFAKGNLFPYAFYSGLLYKIQLRLLSVCPSTEQLSKKIRNNMQIRYPRYSFWGPEMHRYLDNLTFKSTVDTGTGTCLINFVIKKNLWYRFRYSFAWKCSGCET
jgi:hypothetical protein